MTARVTLAALLARPYRFIRVEWNGELASLRVRTRVTPVQCYSLSVMAELQQVFSDIGSSGGLIRHFVMSSDVPGIFNFGGDLSLFTLLIRARDDESLRLYARRCVELIWWMECAASVGVHTTVLVQGDTLGGGLESVMSFHRVIFERSAQAGFPEVLFNLFPGMGAWNFVIRKSGFAVANEMILSGKLYTAEELHRRKLVDLVVDDGQGEAALDELLRSITPRHRGTLAALEGRRYASPITFESLEAIATHWAQTALGLTDRDLRLMERLARAQARKASGSADGAVDEIKRLELHRAWDEERTGITEWTELT